MAERQPADSAQRSRAAGERPEDRRGRMLVEAAAGTGKTTVLLQRVLNYLLAGERRLSEMVLVTFTEQAAAELKVRLRDEIGRRLRGDPEEMVRTHLKEGLADLETAAVGTIHSFCAELLRRRPVEAGVDPAFGVADEFAQRLLKTSAWERLLAAPHLDPQGLAAAFDLDLTREGDLRKMAFTLVHVPPERLPRPEGPEELDFPGRWAALGEMAHQGLAAAEQGGKLQEAFARFLEDWRRLATLDERDRQRGILAEALTQIPRRPGTQREPEAKTLRDEVNQHLAALQTDLRHLRLTELAAWLACLKPLYDRELGRSAQIDFDGLITESLEMLRRSPQVLEELRRQYPVILVDEFQDTDRAQTELLLLLAGDDSPEDDQGCPRSLFLVGDPKQSIYRFRGADLEGYTRVQRQEFPARGRVYLSQTFRPLPAIARWVNEVMARVMASGAGEAPPYEAVYRPLEAAPPAEEPPGGGVLYFDLQAPAGSKVEQVRELEAEAFARLIYQLVNQGEGWVREPRGPERNRVRPARHGDMALLLPKMTALDIYEETFQRYGIPFRVVGGKHYYRRDEVHALVEILRAMADPGDPVAVVSALRGPGFGCSDRELMAYALARPRPRLDAAAPPLRPEALATSPEPDRARQVAEALEVLRGLRRAVRGLPLPDLVGEVLERTGLVSFYALKYRGEQRVANLGKVVEVARRVEAGGVGSLPAFIRWLEGLLAEEPEESDSPYLEGEDEPVRILTIHKAKGLEFPVVLLGGLAGEGSRPHDLQVLPGKGEYLELYWKKEIQTRGVQAAREEEERRERAEVKRLLYVATTRARDLLVLPLNEPGISFYPLFAELYRVGVGRPEEVATGHRVAAREDLPLPPDTEAKTTLDLSAFQKGGGREAAERRRVWVQELAGARAARVVLQPSEGVEPRERGTDGKRERALRLGEAVHHLIAEALRGRKLPEVELEILLGNGEREAAKALAQAFLESDLARRALASAERLVEEPLVLALPDGRILDARLDLAFLEEGGWVLVDHKTDRLSADEVPARVSQYREQLAGYALALEGITGQPVREVHFPFLAAGEVVTIQGDELARILAEAEEGLAAQERG